MGKYDSGILKRLEAITHSLIRDPIYFEYWNTEGRKEALTIDEIIEREKKNPTGAEHFPVISGNDMKDFDKMLDYSREKIMKYPNAFYTRDCTKEETNTNKQDKREILHKKHEIYNNTS